MINQPAIGEQTATEKFNEMLDLHGAAMQIALKTANFQFDAAVVRIRETIAESDHYFHGWLNSDFKRLFAEVLRDGSAKVLDSIIGINRNRGKGVSNKVTIVPRKAISVPKKADSVPLAAKTEEKVCSKCDLPFPLHKFRNKKGGGKSNACTECINKLIKAGRDKHSARKLEALKHSVQLDKNGGNHADPPEQTPVVTEEPTNIKSAIPPDEQFSEDRPFSVCLVFKSGNTDDIKVRNVMVKTFNKDVAEQYALALMSDVALPFTLICKSVTEDVHSPKTPDTK